MADCLCAYYGGSAQIPATEHIQKNGSIKLIVVTLAVDGGVCGTNKQSRGELKHGQTDRQTDPTTVTLAAHAHRGLTIKSTYKN